jgi:molybdenum cofactor cytidylyltransferase
MIFAVLPAAGHSTRMGRPKLSLPLGDRTVLEGVIDALQAGGVAHVLVVVGPHVADLAPITRRAGAAVCLLDRETSHMRETVELGLRWFEERYEPRDDDAWLLVPADHPCLEADIVRDLIAASALHRDRSIFLPTHEGKRGHPALIAWKHVAGMRALPPDEGLNVYLRRQAAETLEMPVTSPGVLLDLDTPEEYERLRGEY